MLNLALLISGVAALCLSLSLLYLLRVERIHAIRKQAIRTIYYSKDWTKARQHFTRGPTYTEMVWQLRKWTFKDFYPELYELKEERK